MPVSRDVDDGAPYAPRMVTRDEKDLLSKGGGIDGIPEPAVRGDGPHIPSSPDSLTPLEKALSAACYMHSGAHLSGYRLCIGFETKKAAGDAHVAIAGALNAKAVQS